MHLVDVTSRIDTIKVDPSDNAFLECAVDGRADYIVSGDRHLLGLGTYRGIQIISPREFLAREGFIRPQQEQ